MGKRNRESTCFYYETPFPNYAPSRRHNKNRWWKNTTCSYHYLWFTLSELIKYRKTRRSCRKSIQFILSCDTNYRRNEVCNEWSISNYRCLGKRHGSFFIKQQVGF